jgi:hypothetical protein
VPAAAGFTTIPAEAFARTSSQRTASLVLVLLLHALLLLAALQFMVKPQIRLRSAAERVLEMIITIPPKPVPAPAPPARPAAPVRAAPGGVWSGAMPSLAPPVAPPDITGLGQALLGCALENLTNLTPEQRAHCKLDLARPDDSLVIEPPSHVKDPVRRAAEMRARNTPLRVPCTSVISAPVGGGTAAVPMVSPFCALDGLINGFGPLNGLPK